MLYTSKGDSRLELTKRGIRQAGSLQPTDRPDIRFSSKRQAKEAGKRLKALAPKSGKIIVCTSPFERSGLLCPLWAAWF